MSGEERRFFSGASLAQAVMAAARHYHLPAEELAFHQREKRHGFTHRTRAVVIEVDPDAPRRSAGVPAELPGRASAPAAARDPEPVRTPAVPRPERRERPGPPVSAERGARPERRTPLIKAGDEHRPLALEAAGELAALAGLRLEIGTTRSDDRIRVELDGADAEWMLARGREPLEAFEVLLRRMLRTPAGEAIPVEVNCRGMREEREGELRSLAAAAATAVRRSGRPVELDPLPPLERRVIHLALAEAGDLITESRGEGRDRRVEVRLREPLAVEEPQTR